MRTQSSVVALMYLFVVGLGGASALSAQSNCADLPNNVLASQNCGLDADTSNWQLLGVSGSIAWEMADGQPPGSLELTSVFTGGMPVNEIATAGICSNDIEPLTVYDYAMSIKAIAGNIDTCTVNLLVFDSLNCAGGPTAAGFVLASFDTSWQTFAHVATTTATTMSGYLMTQCFGSDGAFTLLLDNAVLEGGGVC